MKKIETQFGRMITCDFEDKTITIQSDKDVIAKAGEYALVPIDDYNELVKNNGVLDGVKDELTLADFRVGFNYEEHELDSERYLSKGMCWVKKTYGLNSPRLHKIDKLLKEGKLRRVNSL